MSSTHDRKVAFLGGGRMGEALVSGLIRSGGRSADEIMVTSRREECSRELAAT
jgi:pyrroline-5-carboxylate reductase